MKLSRDSESPNRADADPTDLVGDILVESA
jgi:hypothetical protein